MRCQENNAGNDAGAHPEATGQDTAGVGRRCWTSSSSSTKLSCLLVTRRQPNIRNPIVQYSYLPAAGPVHWSSSFRSVAQRDGDTNRGIHYPTGWSKSTIHTNVWSQDMDIRNDNLLLCSDAPSCRQTIIV